MLHKCHPYHPFAKGLVCYTPTRLACRFYKCCMNARQMSCTKLKYIFLVLETTTRKVKMYFNFFAIDYNKFVVQFLYIFNELDIDVKNIIDNSPITTTIDKKLKKKLNKLHHKYISDSGYLHKSRRYQSRISNVLLYYLTIIINVILSYNDIYFQKILELYENLHDDVLNNLQTEDTYLSAGEEIVFNKKIVSFFTSINKNTVTISSEMYHTGCGCYIFEIQAYPYSDSDSDSDYDSEYLHALREIQEYEEERAFMDDIRRER